MDYKLLYHPDIVKEDLPEIPKNIQNIVRRAIEERILSNPILYGHPLRHSLLGHRKLRVGDYRIIYRVQEDEVIILKIGHRKDVYKKVLKRIRMK